VHFGSSGNIEAYNYTTSAWVTVAAYSVDTTYRLEVEIDMGGHAGDYRVRVNEGTWTAWIGAAGTLTVLSLFNLEDFATNAHALWIDAIGATFPPPPGIPVDDFDSYVAGTALESQDSLGMRWGAGWTKVSGGSITAELAPQGMAGLAIKSSIP
jgi:hypothetical protein